MQVSDFNFDLPEELIAQFPLEKRDSSRMMVLERRSGNYHEAPFASFPDFLLPGDVLVLNDTKVIPARLWGHRPESGGRVQAFMLEERGKGLWMAMLKPGRRLTPGTVVRLDGCEHTFTVVEKFADGTAIVQFDTDDVLTLLEEHGQVPLPPYINRPPDENDKGRYQTVYAKHPGAVAAPTAGLHFTPEILQTIAAKGVKVRYLTLHVGAGTFRPVTVERIEDHIMHSERFLLPPEVADAINQAHAEGHRVFCVGTTAVRVLETCAVPNTRQVRATRGETSIFLYPPYTPQVVDGLLTNFHLPQSTLLMLVSTFCEREKVLAAYREAVRLRFRFFSYGDCMLLLP